MINAARKRKRKLRKRNERIGNGKSHLRKRIEESRRKLLVFGSYVACVREKREREKRRRGGSGCCVEGS